MKIGYVVNVGGTNGGFPQHAETMIQTFKEMGHDVEFFLLNYGKRKVDHLKIQEIIDNDYYTISESKRVKVSVGKGTGRLFLPESGWYGEVDSFRTLEEKKAILARFEEKDILFWHTPFWFKQRHILKDTDWPMLLDAKRPVQIAMHHDANLRANSAWMYHIINKFDFLINVHPASYQASRELKIPRTMIFNPIEQSHVDRNYSAFKNIRDFGGETLLLQNWKSSKHGDDLIRAIPYLNKNIVTLLGGGGIDWRYLNATDKCPDEFKGRKDKDPDINPKDIGRRIIDIAKDHPGYKEIGWISESQRDEILRRLAFSYDTAWYSANKDLGSHFPRTLVEAMTFGVVPFGRNLGLSSNESGNGIPFTAGKNYIMIPWNATPKKFAGIVNEAFQMSESEYNSIVHSNYELLENFDRFKVAQQYLDLAEGKPTGYFGKLEVGESSFEFIQKADKQWYGDGEGRKFAFPDTRKKRKLF